MKFNLYITVLLFPYLVWCNPNCNSNAWIKLKSNWISGHIVDGTFEITSGKNSGSINKIQLTNGIHQCLFSDDPTCQVDMTKRTFQCLVKNSWKNMYWQGVGNIEFNCYNDPFSVTTYDCNWKQCGSGGC